MSFILTLGGTITAIPVPVNQGGTGAATLTGVVKGNGTSSFTASNVVLTSEVTGTLPVANGGTGATSLTANNVLLGNGTSTLQVVAPGTSGNVLTSNGTTWASSAIAAGYTSTTPVTVSGTSVTFTGIPSTAKQVLINFNNINFTGICRMQVRLGNSGGIQSTGYNATNISAVTTLSGYGSNSEFPIQVNYASAQNCGVMILNLHDASSNTWVASSVTGNAPTNNALQIGAGTKTISGGTLSQIEISTSSSAFSSGSINLMYI